MHPLLASLDDYHRLLKKKLTAINRLIFQKNKLDTFQSGYKLDVTLICI